MLLVPAGVLYDKQGLSAACQARMWSEHDGQRRRTVETLTVTFLIQFSTLAWIGLHINI
jgi:hypothetical protein